MSGIPPFVMRFLLLNTNPLFLSGFSSVHGAWRNVRTALSRFPTATMRNAMKEKKKTMVVAAKKVFVMISAGR